MEILRPRSSEGVEGIEGIELDILLGKKQPPQPTRSSFRILISDSKIFHLVLTLKIGPLLEIMSHAA